MQTIALSVPGENRLFPKRNGVTALFCIPAASRRAFYPAPGYRDAMSTRGFGGLRDVGYYGYSWSSAIAGSNARYLDFYYDGVTPQNNNYRAYGLQLRCLQEKGGGAQRILPSSRAGFLYVKTFCAWPAGLLNFGGE